jgi:hypothetical protein
MGPFIYNPQNLTKLKFELQSSIFVPHTAKWNNRKAFLDNGAPVV